MTHPDGMNWFDPIKHPKPPKGGWSSLDRWWWAFDNLNPHVRGMVSDVALRYRKIGVKLSVNSIFESIRFWTAMVIDDPKSDYRLNNNHRSRMSRTVMHTWPVLGTPPYFATRPLKSGPFIIPASIEPWRVPVSDEGIRFFTILPDIQPIVTPYNAQDMSLDVATVKLHEANPQLASIILAMIGMLQDRGRNHFSFDCLWENVRHYMVIKHGDIRYKIRLCNDYRSRFTRILIEENPDLVSFFDTRELTKRSDLWPDDVRGQNNKED